MSLSAIIYEAARIIEGEAHCLRKRKTLADSDEWSDSVAKTDYDYLIKIASQLRQVAADIKGESHAHHRKR